jgi:hypothetical protein
MALPAERGHVILTRDQRDELLVRQGGACAICGAVQEGERTFHADHDHSHCARGCPECVRGLLCHRCNIMLGMAREDPAALEAGAAYLRRYAEGRSPRE